MNTFYNWIKQFNQDITPLGDMARLIGSDNQFPHSKIHATILSYLRLSGYCSNVIPIFEDVFSDYQTDMEKTR